MTPIELLEQWASYSVHSNYYIERHLNPALQRCFGLSPHFIDVAAWFKSCPKPRRRIHFWPQTRIKQSTLMISHFFGSDACSLCGLKCSSAGRNRTALCRNCQSNRTKSFAIAMNKLAVRQRDAMQVARVCSRCNMNFEDAATFATTVATFSNRKKAGADSSFTRSELYLTRPLANCVCTDCPMTFERHKIAESQFEAQEIVETLHRQY